MQSNKPPHEVTIVTNGKTYIADFNNMTLSMQSRIPGDVHEFQCHIKVDNGKIYHHGFTISRWFVLDDPFQEAYKSWLVHKELFEPTDS
jgi:hypothetical protein